MSDNDLGYDLTQNETVDFDIIPSATPGSSAYLDTAHLPEAGSQGSIPDCWVWSSIYGAVSYWAASAGRTTSLAAPEYSYIQAMIGLGVPKNTCIGGTIAQALKWLSGNSGTADLSNAPNTGDCDTDWSDYGSGSSVSIDSNFGISSFGTNSLDSGSGGLDGIKSLLTLGYPVAYGTYLAYGFLNWGFTTHNDDAYVNPNPTEWIETKSNDYVGHCMFIIGYDDTVGPNGAIQIQNSQGTNFGNNGRFFIDYDTFLAMAAGPTPDTPSSRKGFYYWIPLP